MVARISVPYVILSETSEKYRRAGRAGADFDKGVAIWRFKTPGRVEIVNGS